MLLHFIGADHEVTGSCHIIETNGHYIMIDRGMEQGRDLYENEDLPCKPSDIDVILLTHAHIDHSGLVPLMAAQGFAGKIYATRATCDLCDIMLRDSAHIQEFEAEWRNRKGKRQARPEYIPLYTMQDALTALTFFQAVDYNTEVEVLPGVTASFTDVGHLLGSSCISVKVTEGDVTKTLLFSGDVGNRSQPLLKDPATVDHADYMIIESTYGDRDHEDRIDYIDALVPIIQRTLDRGGNVVVPSFAVGRTQEMLYFLRHIKVNNLIKNHDGFKVFVDSPLANEATTIFQKHVQDCFDEEAMELVSQGINPIAFPGLSLSITSEDSIAINNDTEPKVILSASGMCEAGRIKHHLKHNLWRPESTILFVGYQAEGTLGRQLLEGAQEVKLFGEKIAAKAEICNLPGISGHADREGLLKWADAVKPIPQRTFVVHGEDTVCDIFAELIHERLGHNATAPYSGAIYDLIEDKYIKEPAGKPIIKEDGTEVVSKKREAAEAGGAQTAAGQISATTPPMPSADPDSVYGRLIAAGQRLMSLIRDMHGESKKAIGAMLDDVSALADKWDDPDATEDNKKSKKR